MVFYKPSRFRRKTTFRRPFRRNYGNKPQPFNRMMRYKPQTFKFKRWGMQFNQIWKNTQQEPWLQSAINLPGQAQQLAYNARWLKLDFQLNYLPQYREFAEIFRWYKIVTVKVRVSFYWEGANNTQLAIQQGVQNVRTSPDFTVYSLIDKSNTFNPATPDPPTQPASGGGLTFAKQYSSFRMANSKKSLIRICHPRTLGDVGGVESNMQFGRAPWIQTLSQGVPYHGMALGFSPSVTIEALPENYQVALKIDCEYTVLFKGLK